jgi:hypothetical protein
MRRRNSDETLRELERAARRGGLVEKERWLAAVRRREGLDGVQRLARSNDPDLLAIYRSMLVGAGLLEDTKERLLNEADWEHSHFLQHTLVASRLGVERDGRSEVVLLDPPAHVIVADFTGGAHWTPNDEYVDPIWPVMPISESGPWIEALRRLEFQGIDQAWVHGPTVWLSGRVDWSPHWTLAAATGDDREARALRDYMEHRGRILIADEVSGYDEHDDSEPGWLDPPIRVRVLPTRLSDVLHGDREWTDPYWDVEVVGHPPQHRVVSGDGRTIRSLWVYGTSYSVDGETQPTKSWALEPQPDSDEE